MGNIPLQKYAVTLKLLVLLTINYKVDSKIMAIMVQENTLEQLKVIQLLLTKYHKNILKLKEKNSF